MKFNKRGFTLLEILVVIVILAVVAGLAVPVFTANIQKAKAQEAYTALAAVRSAMTSYYALNSSTYVGATLTNIGYDPNSATSGQTLNFTYTMAAPTAAAYIVSASCSTCGTAGQYIAIDQAGATTITGTTFA